MHTPVRSIILMGVTGSGKSTVGKLLANQLEWSFYDGDDFHPEENKIKMHAGHPLTDADRLPWLLNLNTMIRENIEREHTFVLACSALKESYRTILLQDAAGVQFVHLNGTFECIQNRLADRSNHFMNPELLTSQFETLETSADTVSVPIDGSPEEISAHIITLLNVKPSQP